VVTFTLVIGLSESATWRVLARLKSRLHLRGWLGATPPDPRLPRRGLAGSRQLDPSHPALVTCEDAEVEPCPGLEAVFFISLIPITDSGKSEYHTNILLIARVRGRSNVESGPQFFQFYQGLLAPCPEGRSAHCTALADELRDGPADWLPRKK
jgi:hypothetical protein